MAKRVWHKVILMGNLTRDVEVRTTQSGQSVASFSLAVTRSWRDQNGQQQDQTSFINCVAWGKPGEIIAQYVQKGAPLLVSGRLDQRATKTRKATSVRQSKQSQKTSILSVADAAVTTRSRVHHAQATHQVAIKRRCRFIECSENPLSTLSICSCCEASVFGIARENSLILLNIVGTESFKSKLI